MKFATLCRGRRGPWRRECAPRPRAQLISRILTLEIYTCLRVTVQRWYAAGRNNALVAFYLSVAAAARPACGAPNIRRHPRDVGDTGRNRRIL